MLTFPPPVGDCGLELGSTSELPVPAVRLDVVTFVRGAGRGLWGLGMGDVARRVVDKFSCDGAGETGSSDSPHPSSSSWG